MDSIDVYGLGQCSLDFIAAIGSYPPPDVKCEFENLTIQGGGPVGTALVALSRWGFSCAFAGTVGDDEFGTRIRRSLAEEGLDLGGLVTRARAHSQIAFILAEKGTGRRTIFWRRPGGKPLSPDELDYRSIRSARIFHTDGLHMEGSLAAASDARRAGVAVSVDGGTLRDGMLELARMSDYMIVSEHFAAAMVDCRGPEEACRRLKGYGARVAAVTLGERGYVAATDSGFLERPAYPVEAVDTTGCGDIFHAGFIYGILRGWNEEKALDFGSWAAAVASTKTGGRTGIPDPDEYPSIA